VLVAQRSGGLQSEASPGKLVHKTLSQKPFTKIGLVEWLKVKALSSSLKKLIVLLSLHSVVIIWANGQGQRARCSFFFKLYVAA
jgi:hypothetical protein